MVTYDLQTAHKILQHTVAKRLNIYGSNLDGQDHNHKHQSQVIFDYVWAIMISQLTLHETDKKRYYNFWIQKTRSIPIPTTINTNTNPTKMSSLPSAYPTSRNEDKWRTAYPWTDVHSSPMFWKGKERKRKRAFTLFVHDIARGSENWCCHAQKKMIIEIVYIMCPYGRWKVL